MRALILSFGALIVPLISMGFVPDVSGEEVGLLVWILALVTGFLLSDYRGCSGSAIALAARALQHRALRGLPLRRGGLVVLRDVAGRKSVRHILELNGLRVGLGPSRCDIIRGARAPALSP